MRQAKDYISWFDLESTGVEITSSRIVQIAVIITDHQFNVVSGPHQTLVNPEIPIPPKSTEIHGITDDMVKDAPTFAQIAPTLYQWLEPCDWGFYNGVKFDAGLVTECFARVGININPLARQLVDPCQVFHKKEPRDLAAALKFYCDEEMENAHEAMADIMATIKIAKGQMERYEDINSLSDMYTLLEPENICDIDGKFVMKDGEPHFTFGKHRGEPAKSQIGFLQWMRGKDFSKNTMDFVDKILQQHGNS